MSASMFHKRSTFSIFLCAAEKSIKPVFTLFKKGREHTGSDPNMILSRTVKLSAKSGRWWTRAQVLIPVKRMAPESADFSPQIKEASVDFPAPFSPKRAKKFPAGKSQLIFFNTVLVP